MAYSDRYGTGPARTSSIDDQTAQTNIDAFNSWKAEQADIVTRRGEDPISAENEEAHNRNMLRHCLNAYVCHHELDAYAGCLSKNGLLNDDNVRGGGGGESGGSRRPQTELATDTPLVENKCPREVRTYTDCLSRRESQDTVVHTAIANRNCRSIHRTLMQCFEVHLNDDALNRAVERNCMPIYRRLVRCGLNHLWEEYWKAINDVGDQEEFRMFTLSRDPKRREFFNARILEEQERQEQQGFGPTTSPYASSGYGGSSSYGSGSNGPTAGKEWFAAPRAPPPDRDPEKVFRD